MKVDKCRSLKGIICFLWLRSRLPMLRHEALCSLFLPLSLPLLSFVFRSGKLQLDLKNVQIHTTLSYRMNLVNNVIGKKKKKKKKKNLTL